MDSSLNDQPTPSVSSRRQFLRRALALGLALPAGSALLAACGQASQPAAPAKSEAPAQQAPAAPKTDAAAPAAGGATDINQLVEAAKKEGTVVGIGNTIQFDESKATVAKAFRAKYGLPDSFKVDLLEKNLADLYKQIQEEMAAGKLSIDVPYFNTVAAFKGWADEKKLMPFEAPEYAGYAKIGEKKGFVNKPFYVSDISILGSICWNREQIKEEFTSWFDLLKPQYKGKISILSARAGTSTALVFKAMKESPDIGVKFFQELAKLDPTTLAKTDQIGEKVVSGEYPITIFPSSRPYTFAKVQGVKSIAQVYPKEGVAALAVPWAIFADAPHPNAAKLFVNFMRSQEGQQILADTEGRVSGRTDIKSPDPTFVPSLDALKLLPLDEVSVTKDEFQALGKEWVDIFGT